MKIIQFSPFVGLTCAGRSSRADSGFLVELGGLITPLPLSFSRARYFPVFLGSLPPSPPLPPGGAVSCFARRRVARSRGLELFLFSSHIPCVRDCQEENLGCLPSPSIRGTCLHVSRPPADGRNREVRLFLTSLWFRCNSLREPLEPEEEKKWPHVGRSACCVLTPGALTLLVVTRKSSKPKPLHFQQFVRSRSVVCA